MALYPLNGHTVSAVGKGKRSLAKVPATPRPLDLADSSKGTSGEQPVVEPRRETLGVERQKGKPGDHRDSTREKERKAERPIKGNEERERRRGEKKQENMCTYCGRSVRPRLRGGAPSVRRGGSNPCNRWGCRPPRPLRRPPKAAPAMT